MKNSRLFYVNVAALLIVVVLAGCASMTIVSIEENTITGPRQVRQGQDINPKEITLWAIYKNGERKVASLSQSNITFNKHTPGVQTVKVRVQSREASFVTEVMALRTLTVASQPRVTLFKEGQEADSKWPGLEIRGEWDQMGSHSVPVSSCTITGYMKDQPGRQTIRVSYEGLVTTFNIDVRGMASIQIAQNPSKLDYYQGESLNISGLTVRGVWGDGIPDEMLTVTRDDVTGFNGNLVGIQRLTVTKNGKIANFSVEVLGLTSIELDKPPTKTVYSFGEALDLTGIQVWGNYTGADPSKKRRVLIPTEQLTYDGYDPNRIGKQQRVTVMVRGQVANFFVDIELPSPQ